MKMSRKSGRLASGTHAVLDVGTSKVACFIAEIDAAGAIAVRGVGHQLSRGIRAGVITDFQEAETSIIAAVHAAEQMAGQTVDGALLSLSGGGLSSRNVTIDMALMGEEVSERDILDIVEQGRNSVETDDCEVIHCLPVNYTLDGARGIADPRRMRGERLSAELHLVTAYGSVTRNLAHCLARCHLNVEEFVAAPYAAALACVEDDELELGVTVVDMGGGVTGIAAFAGGRNVFCDVVPVGGMHVTSDIAKGLSTTISHAERLKTLHGSCLNTANDSQVMIGVHLLGEDAEGEEGNVLPRATLVSIIRPRCEEIFELVRGRLEASGVDATAGRRIVLIGGASQLLGIRDLAARVLNRQVRLGRPKPLMGLADAVSGPAFSASLGMLHYVLKKPLEERLLDSARSRSGLNARFKGVVGWFR
ncbi:MAG: cell division protein FtsA, partial [Alphaproteobacteria bacterium]|nr:cell division protein FtsA [Alphaproteobacteria bacterium]